MSAEELGRLLAEMIDIDSPTGEEHELARFLAGYLAGAGLTVRTTPAASVLGLGRGRESKAGYSLLLYAPIDTHVRTAEDRRRFGDGPNLLPSARRSATRLAGLGAENPKAFAAAVATAGAAFGRAATDLTGDLWVGLGSGGMPYGDGDGPGHGTGVRELITHYCKPDGAVVAKPGWSVSTAEAGLCWLRLRVQGRASYVGTKHLAPYDNPIVTLAAAIPVIEAWLVAFAEEHRSAELFPQGAVSAVTAGESRQAAFVPDFAEATIDLRLPPGHTPQAAVDSLTEALAAAGTPREKMDLTVTVYLPGGTTDSGSTVAEATRAAWVAAGGVMADEAARPPASGVTDAAILRHLGVPTARIGMPRRVATERAWAGDDPVPLNEVDVRDCLRLVEVLVGTGARLLV
ncbi:peptidase dimerization domain-containing protein [Streptosporangium sp. NPDC051022]|uniref:peptidase dimerization domain-containing protein n=1 Tax=Streptosporangium sp. NPDC051022 TaxID=3155752 RepID=UPI0034181535